MHFGAVDQRASTTSSSPTQVSKVKYGFCMVAVTECHSNAVGGLLTYLWRVSVLHTSYVADIRSIFLVTI